MNTSDLYKINRGAESAKISLEEYEKFHAQAAADAISGKHIEDEKQEDLNKWLEQETKDFKNEGIAFAEIPEHQQAIYNDELRQIAAAHDKITSERLDGISKSQEQKDTSITKYVEQQKASLAKAIQDRNNAKKSYDSKKADLDKMNVSFRDLNKKIQSTRARVDEKTALINKLTPQEAAASTKIVDEYSKKDSFQPLNSPGADYQSLHPGDYAQVMDRNFASRTEAFSDAASEAKDPDVKERIEIEIVRQKSSYAISKNHSIESLTGQSRSEQIKAHTDAEKVASVRAMELDLKLESKGIKVDFDNKSVSVRAITEEEKIKPELKKELETVRRFSFEKSSLQSSENTAKETEQDLNRAGKEINSQAEKVTESRAKLEDADAKVAQKSALLLRIEKQNKESEQPEAKMSDRDDKMIEEARERQAQTKLIAQQQQQELVQSQGQSRGR